MKRTTASLPPIPAQIFDKNVINAPDEITRTAASSKMPNPKKRKETHPLNTHPRRSVSERSYTSTQCLFCTIVSLAVEYDIDHMYSIHGVFTPDPDTLEDAKDFLTDLFNTTSDVHEHLYRGDRKATIGEFTATC